jgi:hypothetical protein
MVDEVGIEEKGVRSGDESTFQLSTRHRVGVDRTVLAITLLLRRGWLLGRGITNLLDGGGSHVCQAVSPLVPTAHIITINRTVVLICSLTSDAAIRRSGIEARIISS